jgi:uncharacterized protein (DUF305 family)
MENKNNIFQAIIILAIGIFLGFLIWGGGFGDDRAERRDGIHMMPNGEMMMDDGGDMSDMMNSMTMGLKNKTGDDFDQAFLSEMIIHHEGAVEMAKQVLKNSKRPELIKLANDIISAQTKEIEIMKGWQTSWFK